MQTTSDAGADELLPEMREFRRRLAEGYAAHPPLDSVPLAQARAIVEAVRAPLAAGGPAMAHSHSFALPLTGLPAVQLRVHRAGGVAADDAPLPALAYLHGGGWVYFSLDTHDRLMREYAARAGRVVVGIGYAHAPEARFPVALRQVTAALQWIAAHGGELGIDVRRLAVGGDSVGANLSLAAALSLRDAGHAGLLQGLLLNYGCYADEDENAQAQAQQHSEASFQRYDGALYTLGRDEMRGFWRGYRGEATSDESDRCGVLAQPLHAELAGLPPALLVVAECDVLRDSSLQLAARLSAAGRPPLLRRYAGAPHSFLEAMSFAAISRQALDDSAQWLRALPAGGEAP